MGQQRVVVVGSANVDLVLEIDHRPAGGETVLGSDVAAAPGGKGANQAVAAGRLGGRVGFVGCVGHDAHGRLLVQSLQSAGVDLAGLRTVPAPTGNAMILLTPDGENAIIVSPGANRHLTPEVVDSLSAHWAGAPVVVLQLEIPLTTVRHVAAQAQRAGSRVVLNAAPAALLPPDVLRVCDPLVVNETEAAYLVAHSAGTSSSVTVSTAGAGAAGTAGAVDPGVLATDLLELGPRSVVVTLGAEGAVLVERTAPGSHADSAGAPVRVPARRVNAVDTTGAGDAFVGALAVELADDAGLADAVRLAAEVATIAVTRRGTQSAYPGREELD